MYYDLRTRNGHNMYDMSSMLQKSIRRCNYELAGYAAMELFGRYWKYLWRRLIVISAEDCYGVITGRLYLYTMPTLRQIRTEKDTIETLCLLLKQLHCYVRLRKTEMLVTLLVILCCRIEC